MNTVKPSHHIKRSHLFERTLPLFLVIVTAIVVVFQAQILLQVREDLSAMRAEIAMIETQSATGADFAPFAALEQNCTDCHSERRFTRMHGSSSDIAHVIQFMEAQPDVELSERDVQRIHSSIALLKCVSCHDDARLKSMAGLSPERQREIIDLMVAKPGAAISEDEARAIEKAIQSLQGF